MHTVELLEETLDWARRMGYQVRHEYLGGTGGGCCQVAGRRYLFVDLALSVSEQLDRVVEALRNETYCGYEMMPPMVRHLFRGHDVEQRKAA